MKRTAIVIDTSGAVGAFVSVFTLEGVIDEVVLKGGFGGTDYEALNRLCEDFDQVFFVTDGKEVDELWTSILNPKIKVISVT